MLLQNKRGMQKPRSGRRPRDADELSTWIEQPDESRDHQSNLPNPKPLLCVARAQFASVHGPLDTLCREHHRRQPWKHVGQRDDRRGRALRIALGRVEIDRLIDSEVGGSRAAKRRKVSANAEPVPEIVRERAHVEAGGTIQAERHSVRFDANEVEAMNCDTDGGRQGTWVKWIWRVRDVRWVG